MDASDKPARSQLRLLDFDFEMVHRAGIKHQAWNTLSRLKTDVIEKTRLDEDETDEKREMDTNILTIIIRAESDPEMLWTVTEK